MEIHESEEREGVSAKVCRRPLLSRLLIRGFFLELRQCHSCMQRGKNHIEGRAKWEDIGYVSCYDITRDIPLSFSKKIYEFIFHAVKLSSIFFLIFQAI